jgi:hypothetical protein
MRRLRHLVGLLLLVAIGLSGCATNESSIRPPKPPEEFRDPPDEPRYTGPVQYPRETMQEDMLLKKSKENKPLNPMTNPRGPGGMPGRMMMPQ